MTRPSIEKVTSLDGEVAITIREWDGIGKPEYTRLENLSPSQAESLADDIRSAADKAKTQKEDKEKTALEYARKRLRSLNSEKSTVENQIDSLERRLGLKQLEEDGYYVKDAD